jgi:hypothetical protein
MARTETGPLKHARLDLTTAQAVATHQLGPRARTALHCTGWLTDWLAGWLAHSGSPARQCEADPPAAHSQPFKLDAALFARPSLACLLWLCARTRVYVAVAGPGVDHPALGQAMAVLEQKEETAAAAAAAEAVG